MAIDQTRINLLKSQVDAKKAELARAEATRDALAKQRQELEAEAAALGVRPDQLEVEIARLESEAAAALVEAERLLAGMNQTAAAGVAA